MKYVIQRLVKQLDVSKIRVVPTTNIDNTIPMAESQSASQEITHAWMWPMLGQWLKEKDVVITETCVHWFIFLLMQLDLLIGS